jgi:uncharacterized membrane protein YccC
MSASPVDRHGLHIAVNRMTRQLRELETRLADHGLDADLDEQDLATQLARLNDAVQSILHCRRTADPGSPERDDAAPSPERADAPSPKRTRLG